MNLRSLNFVETREILRTRVILDDSGIPIWGSEAIMPGRVVPEELLVLPNNMTVESYEKACDVFKDAEMSSLPAHSVQHTLIDVQTREMWLPPVVEVFGEDKVLIFGYEALYKMAADRDLRKDVPVIMVKRTVMKQIPNFIVEQEWPTSPQKYVKLTEWKERANGGCRRLISGE